MACVNGTVTTSLDTGADHVFTIPSPPSGDASENAPLTSLPVPVGSATVNVASPAVEMTVAVVEAGYAFPSPGVNAPNAGALPSTTDSVAGTVAPTSPATGNSVGPAAVADCRSPGWQWCGAKNVEPGTHRNIDGLVNDGAWRTLVACSNAEPTASSLSSLPAVPMNVTPIGL